MARKKLGNQNPTQSVILKYVKKNSKAKEAIELYERTGLSCYSWQINLLTPMMAVDKRWPMGSSEVWLLYPTA